MNCDNVKNKRNYGRFLSLKFPEWKGANKHEYYNSHGHMISKKDYERLMFLSEEIKKLTEEFNKLDE